MELILIAQIALMGLPNQNTDKLFIEALSMNKA